MKIPNTTAEKPYIEFIIDKKGHIKLSTTSSWWGGKNSSFFSAKGEGNSCEPKHLKEYIEAFKKRKIKSVEREIFLLQKQVDKMKAETWGVFNVK